MKKILSILLVTLITFGVASCKKGNNDKNVKKTNTVILCDFESRNEVRKITFGNYFGKNEINSDKNFVISGDNSLKVMPMGYGLGDATGGYPYINFDTKYLNDSDSDYGNFELVEYVMLDVYNDNNDEKTLSVSLTDDNSQRTPDTEFVLSPKAWTRIAYDTNRANLSLTFDISRIKTVTVSFTPTRFDETPPVFYLDRYAYRYTDEKAETEIVLDKDEICSFDKDYQAYATVSSIMGGGGSRVCVPSMSINTSPRFAKSGSSLRIFMGHGKAQDASWPYFTLSEKIIRSIDFTKYGMNDEIVCDIYNDSTTSFRLETKCGIHDENSLVDGAFAVNNWLIKSKEWTECRIKLSEIVSKVVVGTDANNHPVYATDTSVLKDMSELLFCWGEFPGEDRVIYLDSIRVERA